MDDPQEVTALGTLDDPVVIGRGEREDLGDGVAAVSYTHLTLPTSDLV